MDQMLFTAVKVNAVLQLVTKVGPRWETTRFRLVSLQASCEKTPNLKLNGPIPCGLGWYECNSRRGAGGLYTKNFRNGKV